VKRLKLFRAPEHGGWIVRQNARRQPAHRLVRFQKFRSELLQSLFMTSNHAVNRHAKAARSTLVRPQLS